MKEGEWLQLQEHGPGQFMDFVSCYRKSLTGKWQRRTLKEIVQAVAQSLSAMANADGGVVFLGAEAQGEAPESFFDEKNRQLLFRGLEKAVVPPLQLEIPPEERAGQVLPITVKPMPAPSSFKEWKELSSSGESEYPHLQGEDGRPQGGEARDLA